MSNEDEKRMAGDYEITHSFSIGIGEVVMGENQNAETNQRYIVADYECNGIFAKYSNAFCFGEYLKAVANYTQRIQDRVINLTKEHESINFDISPLTKDDCQIDDYDQDLTDKIVVIKADTFKPEYRQCIHQLQLCTGGNGATLHARGRACFCTSLYDGKNSRYERYDILGTISRDKLPDWAKEGLQRIEHERAEKRKSNREAR